jgi:hypothetical protein
MSRMHPGPPPSRRAGRGDDWRAKARKATDMVIAMTCHFEGRDPETIRAAILRHARKALGRADSADFVKVLDADLGDGPVPTEVTDGAGIFRLVFENSPLDRSSESSIETFMVEVQRRLDEVLASPAILWEITRHGPKP